MIQRILFTSDRFAPVVPRVVLGLVLFPHGAQHALGWFGGYGFAGTLDWMVGTLGFPAPLAALAIAIELIAPFLLVAGVAGRLAAVAVMALLATAASTHAANGFFMNWFGSLPAGGEGFEYHILAVALGAPVLIEGSGAWSVDRLWSRRWARAPAREDPRLTIPSEPRTAAPSRQLRSMLTAGMNCRRPVHHFPPFKAFG